MTHAGMLVNVIHSINTVGYLSCFSVCWTSTCDSVAHDANKFKELHTVQLETTLVCLDTPIENNPYTLKQSTSHIESISIDAPATHSSVSSSDGDICQLSRP